jgi:SapC
MRLVELSRSEHGGLRISSDLAEASASTQHLIPLVATEFRKAATQYPIVFAKHPETGRFNSYVLNGLGLNENLFWTGTELDVTYVPLNVRRQPFYVGTDEACEGSAKNVLCIDLDSPCVDAAGTKALVEADGGDSAYLKEILSILRDLMTGREATEAFIANLLSLDLLAPVLLDIRLDDGTPLRLEGLYGLDEERFRQLEESDILQLRKSGHLDLIYAVMMASGQIFRLIRLKNQRIALRRSWHTNAG